MKVEDIMEYKYFTKGLNGKFAWTMEVQEEAVKLSRMF